MGGTGRYCWGCQQVDGLSVGEGTGGTEMMIDEILSIKGEFPRLLFLRALAMFGAHSKCSSDGLRGI